MPAPWGTVRGEELGGLSMCLQPHSRDRQEEPHGVGFETQGPGHGVCGLDCHDLCG